ncbi:MAG: glycosyltransferase [Aggregatilineales bacterium]
MHILHITPYYAPAYSYGGVVTAVQGMVEALAARGHQMTVLTTDTLSRDERYTRASDDMLNGVRVLRHRNLLPLLRGKFNLSTPVGLRKNLGHLLADTDVVHTHEFRSLENMLTLPLIGKYNIPVVLSAHGTLTHSTGRNLLKQNWDRLLSPAIAKHIQHIIALTAQEKSEIIDVWEQFGMIPPLSIIPNGVNLAEFEHLADDTIFREHYNLSDEKIVLFMGRLHPRKGVDVLVRAFKQANLTHTRLVLAGPDEGMMDILSPLLDERIILTGYIDGELRESALSAADVFVLPAIGEGLSMAVLEAMAAGLPVILSPGCNLPEAEAAGAGLIVEPEVDALAAALQTLIHDDAKQRHMSIAASALVEQKFTWDTVAAQLEATYQQLVQ